MRQVLKFVNTPEYISGMIKMGYYALLANSFAAFL